MLLYKEYKIIRDKYTKEAYLDATVTEDWKLFSGESITNINTSVSIANGKNKGVYPLSVSTSVRNYFKLETSNNSAILSETHLPMEGGFNFRDLGGIESADGRHTIWGKIFRSDDLFNLTESDLNYLSSIPISTIVDFRSDDECSALPDKLPNSLKDYYNLSLDPGSLQEFAKSKFTSKEDIIKAMKYLYTLFVTKEEYINRYKEFFNLVQNEEKLPLLFHCSAGKDRTGLAAALLLFALDIPKETIMEDYMASNTYLANKYEALFKANPANKYLYTIIPEYLETTINEITSQYGSVINFLEKKLEVDIEKLKNNFLF